MPSEENPTPQPSLEEMPKEVRFGQDIFQVQAEFAQAVARIEKVAYEDALVNYTDLFNFIADDERDYDKVEDVWQEFTDESRAFVEAGDMASVARVAYEKYNRPGVREYPGTKNSFGCFSYAVRKDDTDVNEVLIHFQNKDNEGGGPLSASKIELRRNELREMFASIREKYPNKDFLVSGGSWMYNIPQYRELFPKEYQESLKEPYNTAQTKQYLQSLGLWGQFLKADGSVNKPMWDEFKQNIEAATSEEELLRAFEVKVLTPRAPVSAFYNMLDE